MDSKDIRFSEKKVDESWKDHASRERERFAPASAQPSASQSKAPNTAANKSSKPFIELLSSLGYQAMYHMGEIPDPSTGEAPLNLEAAKEAIDLLIALKEKSDLHQSREEKEIFSRILPELQMKFSQKS